MRASTIGLPYIRQHLGEWLPPLKEEKPGQESEHCYLQRVRCLAFTPYTARLISAAVGLVLRKPITLTCENDKAKEYWDEHRENVDRENTDLDGFARQVLTTALTYGLGHVLTTFPAAMVKDGKTVSLADLRRENPQPAFSLVTPEELIGWRTNYDYQNGLGQVRIRRYTTENRGEYGEQMVGKIMVISPTQTQHFESTDAMENWEEIGATSMTLGYIPLSTCYASKEDLNVGYPPLESVAELNMSHFKLQSQLSYALHVAGYPILLLKNWESNDKLRLNVAKAITVGSNGDGKYLEPASSSFGAMQATLDTWAEQISNLGVSILAEQKRVAESGVSKQLDRADTNSMLAQLSRSLENSLQDAYNAAGAYIGTEPPIVSIDRDFDAMPMTAEEQKVLIDLFVGQVIPDRRTILELLQQGQVLPDDLELDALIAAANESGGSDITPPSGGRVPPPLTGGASVDPMEDGANDE